MWDLLMLLNTLCPAARHHEVNAFFRSIGSVRGQGMLRLKKPGRVGELHQSSIKAVEKEIVKSL